MLRQFWPEHAARDEIPLAFWQIQDEDLLFDALQYLPCNVFTRGGRSGQGLDEAEIAALPQGWGLLIAVFHLEDEFANEGWDGIANLGEGELLDVIAAYEQLGLPQRAQALRRVLAVYRQGRTDEDALSQAAAGELPNLVDDEAAIRVLTAYVRADPARRFGVLPEPD
ncbi:MAG: hypothetical protein U1E77_12035 [Inhella sp.]